MNICNDPVFQYRNLNNRFQEPQPLNFNFGLFFLLYLKWERGSCGGKKERVGEKWRERDGGGERVYIIHIKTACHGELAKLKKKTKEKHSSNNKNTKLIL